MRAPPLYIWYKLGKTGLELSADEKSQLVTELDVLYGKDVPWYGFEKLEPPTMDAPDREPTYLTARRGVKRMNVSNFTSVFADTHFIQWLRKLLLFISPQMVDSAFYRLRISTILFLKVSAETLESRVLAVTT